MNHVRMLLTLVVVGALLSTLAPRGGAEDAAATTGTVTGTVMDQDGNPVEKARVRLTRAPKPKPGQQPPQAHSGGLLAADANGPSTRPAGPTSRPTGVLTTTTDVDGSFTFESVTPGDYLVFANAPGKGMARSEVQHVEAGQTVTVSLTLQPRQNQQPNRPPAAGLPGMGPGTGGMPGGPPPK